MKKQEFTAELHIKAIVKEAQEKLDTFGQSLQNTWKNGDPPKRLLKEVENLRTRLVSLHEIASKETVDSSDLTRAQQDYQSFQKDVHNLAVEFKLFGTEQKKAMLSLEEQQALKARTEAIEKYSQALRKNQEVLAEREPLQLEKTELELNQVNLKNKRSEQKEELNKLKEAKGPSNLNTAAKQYQKALEESKRLAEQIAQSEKSLATTMAKQGKTEGKVINRLKEYLDGLKNSLKELDLETGKADYDEAIKEYEQSIINLESSIASTNEEINDNNSKLQEIEKKLKTLKSINPSDEFNKLKKTLSALGVEGAESANDLEELKRIVSELEGETLERLDVALEEVVAQIRGLENSSKEVNNEINTTNEVLKEQERIASERQAFENRIKDFLGIAGATQVMRHALRDAMQTITELDETMTEMAVVTDLSVGDYWDQLPEYSKRASELGVSINAAYKAATLYYQQGLKTNEVNAISTETLKMAKIAGLDAAEATDKMTAALRGFNMELNETSAKRVADVYSELAAITAADVKEISSAMTKTASIAHSAGMEFETTAAFLSQIIETTRESAETAGTALKTVVARFQELKKSPDEIGEVDGEIVDANAIETALRSVGVSLRDSSGQFRELDEVFLELSKKWDSLDKNTQRYIATIAAGSRQQSRFIAMMSDYARTQELVTAANNSAGASQKQFEKTMDSLSAKVEKLKNAWHEFTMGIMDSELVKTGVDILTKLLEIINKATAGINGFGASIAKIAGIFTIFKLGSQIFNKFRQPIIDLFSDIVGQAGISGEKSAQAFKQGVERGKNKPAQSSQTDTPQDQSKKPLPEGYKWDGKGRLHDEKGRFISSETAKQYKKPEDTAQNAITSPALKKAVEYTKDKMGYNKLTSGKKILSEVSDARKTLNANGSRRKKVEELENAQSILRARRKHAETDSSLGAKITEAEDDVKKATEALKKYDEEQERLNERSKKGWQEIGEGIGSAGQALTGVGVGISMVGGLLSAMGLEEAGDTIAIIGQGIVFVGGALSALPPLITAITNANPILLIISAALAVILVTILAISAAIKKNSPEEKLKNVQAASERASKAADRATESYENLVSALDGLDDGYRALENLTEGTKEWNEAIIALNNNVLDLIDTYPELARFVEHGENGLLTLDTSRAEVQQVIRESQEKAIISKNNAIMSKIEVAKAQAAVDGNYDRSEQAAIRKQEEAAYVAMATSSKALANTANLSDEQVRLNSNLVNEDISKKHYESAMANLDGVDFTQDTKVENAGYSEKLDQAIQQQYGEDATIKNGKVTYYVDGKEATDTLTNDEIKGLLASQQSTDRTAESFGLADKAMTAAAEIFGEQTITALYSAKEGGALTKEDKGSLEESLDGFDADAWVKMTSDEKARAYSDGKIPQNILDAWEKMANVNGEDARKAYGNDIRLFINDLAEGISISDKAFEKAEETIESFGLTTDEVIKDFMTADMATGFTEKLKDVANKTGAEGLKSVIDAYNNVLSSDQAEGKEEEITSLINATDWTNTESLLALQFELQEEYGYSADAAKAFVETLGLAVNAISKLDESSKVFGAFYQAVQKVNIAMQKLKELQWDYERIIKNSTDVGEIASNLAEQRSTLLSQGYDALASYQAAKHNQAETFGKGASVISGEDLTQYVTYDSESRTYDFSALQTKIDSMKNPADKEAAYEWAQQLEEANKLSQEQLDTAKESYEQLEQLNEASEEAYYTLYEQVGNLIINELEKGISVQQDILDATKTANERLLNKIQEQINSDRQERENDKKEQEISDLQTQSAYLGMNTSGDTNLQKIALDQQIAEKEQEYQDTLVDQSLQQLQDANSAAAEQRERQIALAEQQLEAYKLSDEYQNAIQSKLDTYFAEYNENQSRQATWEQLQLLAGQDMLQLQDAATMSFDEYKAKYGEVTEEEQAQLAEIYNSTESGRMAQDAANLTWEEFTIKYPEISAEEQAKLANIYTSSENLRLWEEGNAMTSEEYQRAEDAAKLSFDEYKAKYSDATTEEQARLANIYNKTEAVEAWNQKQLLTAEEMKVAQDAANMTWSDFSTAYPGMSEAEQAELAKIYNATDIVAGKPNPFSPEDTALAEEMVQAGFTAGMSAKEKDDFWKSLGTNTGLAAQYAKENESNTETTNSTEGILAQLLAAIKTNTTKEAVDNYDHSQRYQAEIEKQRQHGINFAPIAEYDESGASQLQTFSTYNQNAQQYVDTEAAVNTEELDWLKLHGSKHGAELAYTTQEDYRNAHAQQIAEGTWTETFAQYVSSKYQTARAAADTEMKENAYDKKGAIGATLGKNFKDKENRDFDLTLYGEGSDSRTDTEVKTGVKYDKGEDLDKLWKETATEPMYLSGQRAVLYNDTLYVSGGGEGSNWYEVMDDDRGPFDPVSYKSTDPEDRPNGLIDYAKNFRKNNYRVYKTGGIADYTGPAWLDGTPSNPEYVLNAEQTKDYFALQDALRTAPTSKDYARPEVAMTSADDSNIRQLTSDINNGADLNIDPSLLNRITPEVKFKTGGLADFTGPAWLDGTPSKPEYILNASQTERFFTLIDVLEGIDSKTSSEKPSGDNYFDIEINVDKIESDYDVEQMANRIRGIIYEDASYRNVNAINLIR